VTVLSNPSALLVFERRFAAAVVAGCLFLYFSDNAVMSAEEKQPQLQISESDSEVKDEQIQENSGKQLQQQFTGAERKLEETKAAFKEAFDNKGNEADMLKALILEANEEGKAWIFEALVKRLDFDPNPKIRNTCLLCMILFPERGREVAAHALASDSDRGVRRFAAYMLGHLGTEQEVYALLQAVKEDKGDFGHGRNIANMAVSSLGHIGGEQAAKALSEIWNSEELSRDCREQTLNSLAEAGNIDALKTLEDVLRGDDELIRDNAAYGLGQLARKNQENQQLVDEVTKLLRGYINDENTRVQISSIRALGWIGKREDIPLLRPFLEDDNSATVSYTEDGKVKTKTTYPVRDATRGAIDRINKRLPAEDSASTSIASAHRKPQAAEADETTQSGLPTLAYILIPGVLVFLIIGGCLLLLKKKAISRSK
jgi:hypothetical protein